MRTWPGRPLMAVTPVHTVYTILFSLHEHLVLSLEDFSSSRGFCLGAVEVNVSASMFSRGTSQVGGSPGGEGQAP